MFLDIISSWSPLQSELKVSRDIVLSLLKKVWRIPTKSRTTLFFCYCIWIDVSLSIHFHYLRTTKLGWNFSLGCLYAAVLLFSLSPRSKAQRPFQWTKPGAVITEGKAVAWSFYDWENCCSSQGHGTAQVGCGGDNTWFVIDDADDEHMEEDHEIEKADCRLKYEDEDAVIRTSRKKNGKPGRFVSKPDSLWVQYRWWE